MTLKVGDRVEYTGKHSYNNPRAIGWRGRVVSVYDRANIVWENGKKEVDNPYTENLKNIREIEPGDRVKKVGAKAFGLQGVVRKRRDGEYGHLFIEFDEFPQEARDFYGSHNSGNYDENFSWTAGNFERIGNEVTISQKEFEEFKKQKLEELDALKNKIEKKALSMAGQPWCREGIEEALVELGIRKEQEWPADPGEYSFVHVGNPLHGWIRGSGWYEPTHRTKTTIPGNAYWSNLIEYWKRLGKKPSDLVITKIPKENAR